jgi:hypothetical protein
MNADVWLTAVIRECPAYRILLLSSSRSLCIIFPANLFRPIHIVIILLAGLRCIKLITLPISRGELDGGRCAIAEQRTSKIDEWEKM